MKTDALSTIERRRLVHWRDQYQYQDIFDRDTITRLIFVRWLAARQIITEWPDQRIP